MGYLDELRAFSEKSADGSPTKPTKPGSVSSATTPGGVFLRDARQSLAQCRAGLGKLDPVSPLHGLDLARWRRLLDDAQWLFDSFAPAAFRNGWTPGDLFGLWHHDGGLVHCAGGVADRLDGARSLVMTEDRATWRTAFTGEPASFFRGVYPNLRPLWETFSGS